MRKALPLEGEGGPQGRVRVQSRRAANKRITAVKHEPRLTQ